jgi:hypothetical protein
LLRAAPAWSLIRKTSLQDRTDNPLRSSKRLTKHLRGDPLAGIDVERTGSARSRQPLRPSRCSERSSLHDVRHHAPPQFPRAFSSRESIVRTDTNSFLRTSLENPTGGARRDRTDDLLLAKQALSQLSYGPKSGRLACQPKLAESAQASLFKLRRATFARYRERRLVGLGRFELPTSRLSSARSNQLSYKP